MKRKFLFSMILILLAFIWIHSVIPEHISAKESLWITNNLLIPVLHPFGIVSIEKEVVRKAAHIIEYLLISIILSCYWKNKLLQNIYSGFLIAFLDESIQMLTGRGALILDVWIDLVGIFLGTAVVWMLNNSSLK